MPVGDNYILPGLSDHDRLRVISDIHDGATRQLLLQAGLISGARFVELGCGMGYVTRWAAEQGAIATGLDVDEDQVRAATDLIEPGKTNVSFRAADIYDPDLEPGSIDVAYCRWLLVHLNRPVEALRVIYRALKPGGVMVCEEAGVSAIYTEPRSAAYDEMREIALEAGRRRGANYDGGRSVHLWALDAGFDLIHCAAYHPHFLSGPYKGFWNWTFRNATRSLISDGTLTEARFAELVAGMNAADSSPTTIVAHCRMHQLIARKPTSE